MAWLSEMTGRESKRRESKRNDGYKRADVWLNKKAQQIADKRPREQSISDFVNEAILAGGPRRK